MTAALFCGGSPAVAQVAPLAVTVTVDEDGNGSILFAGSPESPLPGVLIADPGPGGLAAALTYNLLGPPSLVAGDVQLIEPPQGALSDLIRFNPAGTGSGNYPASLVFYSDTLDGSDNLADTGFPTSLYTNVVSVPEVGPEGNNGATYHPTAGQPGFVAGFDVTYVFISDSPTAPEPASLALLGIGAAALAGYGWCRRKRTA